ncbi:MAG: retroviral-like aspartic protease family protein [Anaerolineae bacterium]
MPSYDLQMDPPAPFVHVQITNPATGETCTLRAKLDTGASMSVLPESVAEELSLEPMGRMQCYGYDGTGSSRPIYFVSLDVMGLLIPILETVSAPRHDVLLGRDVLNQFDITLKGKNLTFEMVDP